MDLAEINKLQEEIENQENNDVVTQSMEDIYPKDNKTIQKSYSMTEHHHKYLLQKVSKVIAETGKNTSVSRVLRSIIDEDIKRNIK